MIIIQHIMRIWWIVILALTFGIFAAPSLAVEVIEVAIIEAPMESSREAIDGLGHGLVRDLLTACAEAEGIDIRFHYFPLKRTYYALRQEQVMFSYGNPRFMETLFNTNVDDYDMVGLVNHVIMAYVNKKSFPNGLTYHSARDLKGYKVGELNGSPSIPIYRNEGIAVSEFQNFFSAMNMLANQHLDVVIMSALSARQVIISLPPWQQYVIKESSNPVLKIDSGLIYKKTNQTATSLAEIMEHGYYAIRENGRYQSIIKRYAGEEFFREIMLP